MQQSHGADDGSDRNSTDEEGVAVVETAAASKGIPLTWRGMRNQGGVESAADLSVESQRSLGKELELLWLAHRDLFMRDVIGMLAAGFASRWGWRGRVHRCAEPFRSGTW